MRATPSDSQAAPLPAPSSTLHPLGKPMVFGSDGGAGPADRPGGASANEERQQQMSCFSRECANPHHGPLASSACRTRIPSLQPVLVVDWMTRRVSSSADATSPASTPLLSSSILRSRVCPVLRKRLRTVWRHRPSSDLPVCTSNSCATHPGRHASSIPLHRSRTCASSDVPRPQCCLHG